MEFSPVGFLVCVVLLLFDWSVGGRLIVALLASLAFGATGLVAISFLGGSSPLIFSLFSMLIIASTMLQRRFSLEFVQLFRDEPLVSWSLVFLMVYVLAGSVLLPRVFLGETVVFMPTAVALGGGVQPFLLAPSGGNITQSAYLAINCLTFFAIAILLATGVRIGKVTVGLFCWASIVAVGGLIDLMGKIAGLGDVLEPIRTANFVMMTGDDSSIGGFYRIAGTFSEASAFSGAAVPCLAFSVTYWKLTRNGAALWLSVLLLALIVVSTSTTAYVALAACIGLAGMFALGTMMTGRVRVTDLILAAFFLAGVAIAIGIYFLMPKFFEPLFKVFDIVVLQKATSSSALERGMWNTQALQAFLDTYGLGVGIGGTFTSSWIVALLSHLGFIGAGLFLILVFATVRGVYDLPLRPEDAQIVATTKSVQAASIATLIASMFSATTSNPGLIFFVALATIVACRRAIVARRRTSGQRWFSAPVVAN